MKKKKKYFLKLKKKIENPSLFTLTHFNTYLLFQKLYYTGREALIINMDPANEEFSPDTAFSITEFITVDSVMDQFNLGPNGALIYCMEWILDHCDEIFNALIQLLDNNPACRYLLFDFPGQIELYTSTQSVQQLLQIFTQTWHIRCVVAHLTDATLCSDPSHYISSLLVSLSVMLHIGLPHVNILSKADLLTTSLAQLQARSNNKKNNTNKAINSLRTLEPDQYDGETGLLYLTQQIDAEYALPPSLHKKNISTDVENVEQYPMNEYDDKIGFYHNSDDDDDDNSLYYDDEYDDDDDDYDDDDYDEEEENSDDDVEIKKSKEQKRSEKRLRKYIKNFKAINRGVAELLDEYSLVQLTHLSIHDKHGMLNALQIIDKANGYAFKDVDLNNLHLDEIRNIVESSSQTSKEYRKQFAENQNISKQVKK